MIPAAIPTSALIWIVGLIFVAGSLFANLKTLRKDVNGIGNSVRRQQWNLLIALLVITDSRDDRQRIADLLRQQ